MALIPKFTIKQMLLLMIGVGFVAACMAGAARGNWVAYGLSVALIGLLVPLVVSAVFYWSTWFVAFVFEEIFSARKQLSLSTSLATGLETQTDSPTDDLYSANELHSANDPDSEPTINQSADDSMPEEGP